MERHEFAQGAAWFSTSTNHGPLNLCFGGLWGQRKGKKVCTSSPREKVLHLLKISWMALHHFEETSNVGSSMPPHLAETEALHLGKGSALFLLLFARASANGFQRRPLHVSGDALRTKSGSGTVSVNLSPPSFVEASEKPPKILPGVRGLLDVSVPRVSFTFNCEHCSTSHTYNVSPASKTKPSNVGNKLAGRNHLCDVHVEALSPHMEHFGFHGAKRLASVEKSMGRTLTELCSSRILHVPAVLTRAIRARQNLHAIPRDGLENSDPRGEFLFDAVGFLATVNKQRSDKVQDTYVSTMLMAPAASPGGQCHGWRRLAKN